MSKEVVLNEIPKTTEGLRDALFDELNELRAGRSNPQKSRAIAQMADKIIDSIRVQIQFGRLLQDTDKKKITHYLGSTET